MFQKYNINDLFIASISVIYPETDMWETNIGGIFKEKTTGYGYLTILRKVGDKYIDLNNTLCEFSVTRDPKKTSYIINYTEPLSKYYKQNGGKKENISKREAIKEASKHYNTVHEEHFAKTLKIN